MCQEKSSTCACNMPPMKKIGENTWELPLYYANIEQKHFRCENGYCWTYSKYQQKWVYPSDIENQSKE